MSLDNPVNCTSCGEKIWFVKTRDTYTSGPKKGKPIYNVMSAETRLKHDCPKKKQKRVTELGDNSLYKPHKQMEKKKDYTLFYPSGRFCPVCQIELEYVMAHCHGKREICNHCKVEISICRGHGQFIVNDSGHQDYINITYPETPDCKVEMYERGWYHNCGGVDKMVDMTGLSSCPNCNKPF